MTNERMLVFILVTFVVGAIGYFTFTKFKNEVVGLSASPSPSPQALSFTFTKTPTPNANGQSPTELPLSKNKRLGQFPGMLSETDLQNKKVAIQTKKGVIELEIYPEASMAASNFLLLSANGFYDNLTFHRVEPGFVIQGGDPAGNGTGGPGYQFADEPVTKEYIKGTLAMANAGPNTNGSQFFIMLGDKPELPKNYTIFGAVIKGMEVVEKIAVGDVMEKVVVQNLQ